MAETKKNIMTFAGLRALEDELFDLKVYKRKEVAQKIKEALDACDTKYAKTVSFTDTEEIAIYLMALMKPEDIVLLKGSNGMKLSEVVNILTN